MHQLNRLNYKESSVRFEKKYNKKTTHQIEAKFNLENTDRFNYRRIKIKNTRCKFIVDVEKKIQSDHF